MRKPCSSFHAYVQRSPLTRTVPFRTSQGFLIVDFTLLLIWVAQIFSPSLWLGTIFAHRGIDGRFHQNPHFTDVYILTVLILGFFFLALRPPLESSLLIVIIISSLVIVEIVQYHFYLVFLRPFIDSTYRQYSGIRTVINTCIAFINLISYFAVIYLHAFHSDFSPALNAWTAWAYSVGEISGSGFSGVTASPSLGISLISAAQKIVGLLFIAIIISLALGRLQMPNIGADFTNYDPYATKVEKNPEHK
jgi:hypothetical protein